jgi:ABC-type polysaccharide/polyol phosphate export permease
MLVLRLVFGLLLAAGLVSFAIYLATGNPVWRRRGIVIVKWTVIAGLGAAAVILLERSVKFL